MLRQLCRSPHVCSVATTTACALHTSAAASAAEAIAQQPNVQEALAGLRRRMGRAVGKQQNEQQSEHVSSWHNPQLRVLGRP